MSCRDRLILILEDPDEEEALAAIEDFLELKEGFNCGRIVVYRDAVKLLTSRKVVEALKLASETNAEVVVVGESLRARSAGTPPGLNVKVEEVDSALAIRDEDVVIRQGSTCPYSVRI
ncbi:MAG: HPr family phosphocarrier protein [Desulfurococcales archaeon]|nr:HPr family phosphocarrier protein [Desulfurococcales archaeon]